MSCFVLFPRNFVFLFLLILFYFPVGAWGQRQSEDLANGWQFIQKDVPLSESYAAWSKVQVPHTWNAIDSQDGKEAEPELKYGYYRGACWYARKLDIPLSWKGKRVFIRFGAASIVAKTYLNGKLLGEHRGAFNAFCYELTPFLRFDGSDELRVQVDNSPFPDVPPLAGDFNMPGGIYRPVKIIVTGPLCISPLDHASPGVYITQKELTPQKAVLEVKTMVSNGGSATKMAGVNVEIRDASGHVVGTAKTSGALAPGKTLPVVQNVSISQPHLWNGRKDPYLYSVHVAVGEGAAADEVTQPLGLRTVKITDSQGFLLNGQPYPIYGVSRHQDRRNLGWALRRSDHESDEKDIFDMGATAVRLAHYPQDEYFYELCDRDGLLLWNEVSLVNELGKDREFEANAREQLQEMVLQRYNHPSIAFVGIYNEIQNHHDNDRIALALLPKLKDLVHAMYPGVIVVGAIDRPPAPFNQIPDRFGINVYPGWYAPSWYMKTKMPELMTDLINYAFALNHNQRIAISEYGAGGDPYNHLDYSQPENPLRRPNISGHSHPEEWQTYVHEQDWLQIRNNPHLWGSFIWVMFDFSSDTRNEGGVPGINDKGLVTQDRAIKKDAYYFYKANWNPEPMVYIASRRMTPRKVAATSIEVFSNLPQIEVTLNGQKLASSKPDEIHVFRWSNVTLKPGVNRIEAVGTSQNNTVKDSCEWTLASSEQ